jgi:Na+/H+-translocating membrane pyrophosphatase
MQTPADVVTWATVVGIVLPYLLALFTQPKWSAGFKRICAVAASLLLGIGTALFSGQLDNVEPTRTSVLAASAAVLVASQAMYAKFAKPTTDKIEVATALPGGRE